MSTPPGSLLIQAKTQGQDQQPRELLGCSVHSFSVRIIVIQLPVDGAPQKELCCSFALRAQQVKPTTSLRANPAATTKEVCVCGVGL